MKTRLRRFARWLFVPKAARSEDKYRGEAFANGLELVVPTVVFTLLGLWADSSWGTAPLFLILGFVFGAVGTYASQYYKYRARSAINDEGKPWGSLRFEGRMMAEPANPSDMPVPEISVPDPDGIESRIAKDIARHALWVAPVAILAVGLWQGVGGALGVALAFVVVLANFLITGALLGWAARISPAMIMAVSLGGFLVWLIVIFGTGVLVEQIDAVNLDVYVVSVLVLHLGLLFWEMRSISFSLASPGLKPRKS